MLKLQFCTYSGLNVLLCHNLRRTLLVTSVCYVRNEVTGFLERNLSRHVESLLAHRRNGERDPCTSLILGTSCPVNGRLKCLTEVISLESVLS